MKEEHAPTITITDMKASTFKGNNHISHCLCHKDNLAMLEFIYNNYINLTEPLAINLLEVADKYSLIRLKDVCEDFLIENITPDNMVTLGNYAEKYDALMLRNGILEFIMKNLDCLRERDDLLELPKSILVKGLFRMNRKRKFFK